MAIHYVSDFKWYSNKSLPASYKSVIEQFSRHLNYVRNKATYISNENYKNLFEFAYERLQKRYDSRIALSFHIALPNSQKNNKKNLAKKLEEFIEKEFNIDKENIYIFFHEDSVNNFHAHIITTTVDKSGKAFRFDKKFLSNFHKKYDEFLKEFEEVYKVKDHIDVGLTRYEMKKLQKWKSLENERKAFYEKAKQIVNRSENVFKAKVDRFLDTVKGYSDSLLKSDLETIRNHLDTLGEDERKFAEKLGVGFIVEIKEIERQAKRKKQEQMKMKEIQEQEEKREEKKEEKRPSQGPSWKGPGWRGPGL